jgi:hypothetical protein
MLMNIKWLEEMMVMNIICLWDSSKQDQSGFAQGKGMKYRAFHFAGLGA